MRSARSRSNTTRSDCVDPMRRCRGPADHSTAPTRPSPLTSTSGLGVVGPGSNPRSSSRSTSPVPASRIPASPAVVTTRTCSVPGMRLPYAFPLGARTAVPRNPPAPWTTRMSPERVRGSSGQRRYASAARRAETSRSDVRSASDVATSASIVALSRCAFASWEDTTATDPAPASSTIRPAATPSSARRRQFCRRSRCSRAASAHLPDASSASDASRNCDSVFVRSRSPVDRQSSAVCSRPPRKRSSSGRPSASHDSAAVDRACMVRCASASSSSHPRRRGHASASASCETTIVVSSALTSRAASSIASTRSRAASSWSDFTGKCATYGTAVRAQGHEPQQRRAAERPLCGRHPLVEPVCRLCDGA